MNQDAPVLVTGGSGFIGSNFIIDWFSSENSELVNLDLLTYAGNQRNLSALEKNKKYHFIKGDICEKEICFNILKQFKPRAIIHFAAESHVDRSIHSAKVFLQTNIIGTHNLLEVALQYWKAMDEEDSTMFRFIHVSTDEVYGSLEPNAPSFTEKSQIQPNSPYAASKAASDHLVRAWYHTYGLPAITTNCSNNYGPYQFPEKLIPLAITNAISGKKLPIYGDGQQVRDWLYVQDHCSAIRSVLKSGRLGEVYSIGGGNEKSNLEVVHTVCSAIDSLQPARLSKLKHPETIKPLQKYSDLITFVKDRPGHDRRYAINASKIRKELNWHPLETFERGIQKTVEWYTNHLTWLESIQSGTYQSWTQKQYNL